MAVTNFPNRDSGRHRTPATALAASGSAPRAQIMSIGGPIKWRE